jgi:hypothetical protein
VACSRPLHALRRNQPQTADKAVQPVIAGSVAVFATLNVFFALAQIVVQMHIESAFQASSPKTSEARSATIGPFFARMAGDQDGGGQVSVQSASGRS